MALSIDEWCWQEVNPPGSILAFATGFRDFFISQKQHDPKQENKS